MPQDTQSASESASNSRGDVERSQPVRRFFLGPVPYTKAGDDHDEQIAQFVRQHGLRIFLQSGGVEEEWSEGRAREFIDRLKESLSASAWRPLPTKRKGMMPSTLWKGDSFEVGKVLGVSVNMLAPPPELVPHAPGSPGLSSIHTPQFVKSAMTVHWDTPSKSSAIGTRASPKGIGSSQTPTGAPKNLQAPPKSPVSFVVASESLKIGPVSSPIGDSEETHGTERDASVTSSTSILRVSAQPSSNCTPTPSSPLAHKSVGRNGGAPRTLTTGIRSILSSSGKRKGKAKAVRYDATPSGDEGPAPPEEVLGRAPRDVGDSSAAAAADLVSEAASSASEDNSELRYGDVIMRDRMLVRVFRCDHSNIKKGFDERECRITRGLEHKEWDEFLIVWRKRQIELYEDYRTPCKERFLGHKHLAFVIPLTPKVKLSLFSSVDLSFSLVCPPTPTKLKKGGMGHRSIFHRSSRGLNVFVFKVKSRSRAVDWIWNLWTELGGILPKSFEVSCPIVHTRLNVPIPDDDGGWKSLTRDYIIDQCSRAMEKSFAWQTVVQLPIMSGRRLELCWRTETKLDWIWLKDDVEGNRRDWEVLFGMALQYPDRPTQLELRLALHYPTHISLKDGKRLDEPPAIEGYVHIVGRKSQVKTQYYLSTHDGYLCSVVVDKAFPPPAPTDLKNYAQGDDELRGNEHIRLRMQIMNAKGFWDLRSVHSVRRASHVVAPVHDESVSPSEDFPQGPMPRTPNLSVLDEEAEFPPEVRRSDSDVEDEGGEAGMAKVADKGRMRMYRSFELVLRNGRIIRFETYSTKVAVEWVAHLRALIAYWARRHRADTTTEMNLIKESLGRDRITVSKRSCKAGHDHPPELPPTPEDAAQYMDEFWHWCVLEGCREIVKSGRMYVKNKLRGQYRNVHLFLIRGCLVQFKLSSNNNALHHHQIGRINLVDAYVCSGYYAALALPHGEYDPNAPAAAKIFSDGLETKDEAEDTLFALWYRPQPNYSKGDFNQIPIPTMNSKHKVLVCRARSRLERDAWCWALNCELEKLVRRTKEREKRAREQGMPM